MSEIGLFSTVRVFAAAARRTLSLSVRQRVH
jgi:hypothetical protein